MQKYRQEIESATRLKLEQEMEREKEALRAAAERDEALREAELAHKRQLLQEEHEKHLRELAESRQLLEKTALEREAELRKRQDVESANVQVLWRGKFEEWQAAEEKRLSAALAEKEQEIKKHFETLLNQERQAIQLKLEEERRRMALEHERQTALLAQHETALETQFQASQKTLLEEFMQKEKRLASEWAKKDQSAAERYEEALAIERKAALEQVEKSRHELAQEKEALGAGAPGSRKRSKRTNG